MTFTIRIENIEILIPIHYGNDWDEIAIPPRCEAFKFFKINNFKDISFIEHQELAPGIFIANTIINNKNPTIRVINTTDSTAVIKNNLNITGEISEYNIFKIDETSNSIQRTHQLKEIFSKNTPHDKVERLMNLCKDYTDIFTLEDDKMTTNNFYEQKIRITDDNPIYTKNYRLAHGQKEEINKQVNKLLENNLIEPSLSPYNSPIILVPKKSTNNEKKWRLCIDYRKVNAKLVPDKFPLPRIDVILDGLGNAKYFSTLDLFAGFHQIPLEKSSREITSFSTENGIYQWKVLPFGLNIAPNSFCRMMAIAFSGLKPEQCFLYVDDIIVLGKNERNHMENLKYVFDRCRKYNLKLNPEKCVFFRTEITYLGHKCTDKGILPDDRKTEAVQKYPTPKDKAAVKSFTAFTNYYRRFIENYAEIARPLHKMTGKNAIFEWTDECEKAFQLLKAKLLSPTILQYPDFSKEFIITVDASNYACGAVLSQHFGDKDLPIAYISRTFEKGEKNKPIIEKELLAIHFAIKTFTPYIWGKHFTVKTDHKPLVHLYNLKDPSSKLSMIRMDLEKYNFTIEYIPGHSNVTADALSRITINDLSKIYENKVTLQMTASKPLAIHLDTIKTIFEESKRILAVTRSMTRKQNENRENIEEKEIEIEEKINYMPVIEEMNNNNMMGVPKAITNKNNEIQVHTKNKKRIYVDNITNETNLEYLLSRLEKIASVNNIYKIKWPRNDKIFKIISINEFKEKCNKILKKLSISIIDEPKRINDKHEINELMKEYHENVLYGGHFGQKKLLAKLRERFYWKNMSKSIANFVRNCEKCKLNKIQSKTREEMKITPTPNRPFNTIIVDTIGPLKQTEKHNVYAVSIICDLSKYLIMVPIPDKTAKNIAKAIFEKVFLIYGPVLEIRTDRGTEYKNKLIGEICKTLNIDHKLSTAYHHETLGAIERNHRTLNEYIRIYANNIEEWDEYVQYFTYCYNVAKHAAFDNKYSPYELIFGKTPREFNEILKRNRIEPIYNIDNYLLELKYKLQIANDQARQFVMKNKEISKQYYDRKLNIINLKIGDKIKIIREPRNKHKQLYDGPFLVHKIDNENIIYLNNNKELTIHKNRVLKY